MQLKPLTKGRFHNIWQQDDALIEKIFQELLSETQIIEEDEYLYRQGTGCRSTDHGAIRKNFAALQRGEWSPIPVGRHGMRRAAVW